MWLRRFSVGRLGAIAVAFSSLFAAILSLGLPPLGGSSVLATDSINMKLVRKGRDIANSCRGCHGAYGAGDTGTGTYIRGVGYSKVKEAVNGIRQMRFLARRLTDDDVRAVAAYYSWLGSMQLVKTLVKRGRFIPPKAEIRPGTTVQLIIDNTSTTTHTFVSDNMGLKGFEVSGRRKSDMVWVAPEREGTYSLRCADCRDQNHKFTLVVDDKARSFSVPEASKPYLRLAPEPVVSSARR